LPAQLFHAFLVLNLIVDIQDLELVLHMHWRSTFAPVSLGGAE
jgi:hypothetical protein